MKKLLIATTTILLCAGTVCDVTAQQKKKAKKKYYSFDEGSSTLGLSGGLGSWYTYYGSAQQTPAIALTYDHGVDNWGGGTLGIGGIAGYVSARYDYPGGYRATWTSYIVAFRGTWHLHLGSKSSKFDPYLGAMIGVRMFDYKDTYYDYYGLNPYSYNSMYIASGAFVGARYRMSRGVGLHAEAGYDIAYLKVGVNFSL